MHSQNLNSDDSYEGRKRHGREKEGMGLLIEIENIYKTEISQQKNVPTHLRTPVSQYGSGLFWPPHWHNFLWRLHHHFDSFGNFSLCSNLFGNKMVRSLSPYVSSAFQICHFLIVFIKWNSMCVSIYRVSSLFRPPTTLLCLYLYDRILHRFPVLLC